MIVIDYPAPDFRTRVVGGKEEIFDLYRKSWIRLTPEEWVRQNTIKWMVEKLQYPAVMIAIEKEIWLGELRKRFDILVYNRNHQPWMMIECKAPEIPLSEKVLMQVLRYNMVVPVTHLVITNGRHCMAAERKNNGVEWLNDFPSYTSSLDLSA
jgi:hypothetical protein